MDALLDDLNDAQREAVLHGDGPLLVLAGAGSGKTRVIVHRIAHLIREHGVAPWHVLAVTFTNKAAGEMRERLEALLGPTGREAWVQTFHAFGARFLRREAEAAGLPPAFAIYDDDDQRALVKRLLAEMGVDDDARLGPREALSRVDRWKNLGLSPGDVRVEADDAEGEVCLELYRRYERALKRAGSVDFGDLLLRPAQLLEADPGLQGRWRRRFRYILVDEFQDTNPAQYRLLRLLCGEPANVCVVGDDDQAIYRWRGADVGNILDFDKHFPGTRVVKLEQNYRSSANVLAAAHAVISKASRRREKKLWTEREAGAPLRLVVAQDEHEEAQRLAAAVEEERRRGTRGDEIAILYRVNAQSRPIEAALRAVRVPYVIVRGTSFYERAEVRDAAAYLRLALSPASDLDLLRVLNRPARGIGEKTIARLRAFAEAASTPLFEALARRGEIEELKPAARRSLGEFHAVVASLHADVPGLDAGAAVQEALARSGLLDRLRAEGTDESVEKAENLLELVAAAREYDEARAGEPAPRDPDEPRTPPLAGFLEQIALLGEADAPTPEGRVALMTLHAAKGLEFEAVLIAGLEEGLLPYERPWRRDVAGGERAADVDEERRLCYVGMTRAKSRLTLSLARRRMAYGEAGPSFREREPSRFLGDLPPELFGLPPRTARPVPTAPVVRRHPGALPGEPVIEYDGESAGPRPRRGSGPTVDYSYDQRPEGHRPAFAAGTRVLHAQLGEGLVRACDGPGPDAKVTVSFPGAGEKRVIARFLRLA
ncbi:MAG TPA: UvrD-helicase domain-containing protein [Anaeromyxobacteraceae bacterium]|nr:UvrD-helicase domain-containing protein [Anaeromyxobacteraceae bacterium]